MRACHALILGLSLPACASGVRRLDGAFPTPFGVPQTNCEKASWLVPAPTRVVLVSENGRGSTERNDGVALYRIGSKSPESVPVVGADLPERAERFEKRRELVQSFERRRYAAAGLGAAGLVAIAIGSVLFVNAFETRTIYGPGGSIEEEQEIDGTLAPLGGTLILAGFGMGIGGIALNPGQSERSRAEAARYVFLPPEDSRQDAIALAEAHNQIVRERCERRESR